MPNVDKRVAVIHGVFMLKGAYTTHGQVVSDPADVDYCMANHRDKCVPSGHSFDAAGDDQGVAPDKPAARAPGVAASEDHE